MKLKSHYCFGLYLLSGELYRAEGMEQTAFLYGFIEPDLNPVTYLKQRDILFTLRAVPGIIHAISDQTLLNPAANIKQEVLYENSNNI